MGERRNMYRLKMGSYPFLGSAGMFLQKFYGNCQVKNDQLP